ncbi:MAG: long-chain fatty acid--CoA ligase, partial [Deltaproteobacteria bacterium]|nr:long-chain fatty acid--CoA ligase [Deltaproteobacteria bacterium]
MTELPTPWPGYRAAPARLNLAAEVLDATIDRGAESHTALVGAAGSITYESLHQRVNALATSLIDLGLKRGDLALIKMGNSVEFAAAFLAAVKLGVIPVLVNSLLSAGELASVVEQAHPRLIFTEAARADAVRELRRRGLQAQVVCAHGA